MRPAPPLLLLLPALALVPLLLALPGLLHGGGWDLIGEFAAAAFTPSLDPELLQSLWTGVGVTAGMALLGWGFSLFAGLVLGLASSRTLWRSLLGRVWPSDAIRRLLAVPRSIHELLWGLLLLQLLGLQPVVAVLAIGIPYAALVARVVSDQLDALPTANLEVLRTAGASTPAALLTALGPPLLPGVLSYGGYRLECALRSATLLGVFGLGGLGTELKLTLQSLEFHQLWSGLWLLLALMLLLESGVGLLRRRWAMPRRLALHQQAVGLRGREMVLALAALLPLLLLVGQALGVDLAGLTRWHSLPGLGSGDWRSALNLPWPQLLGGTLLLTVLSAGLAVGLAPLQILFTAPWPWAQRLLGFSWMLARLWPPPLTLLLLLFVLKPSLITAAWALGLHNLGILGRLLREGLQDQSPSSQVAMLAAGSGPRLALFYGRMSGVARYYLAYGAYRSDVMLRETVVVGLAGGMGLGSQMLESLSSFAWDQLAVLVLVYALLTLAGEELSDRLRRRLLFQP